MTGPNPRQRLLDGAIEHVAQSGIGELTLRDLAAALGTSHRMLIHHFGSKQGLLVAIVRSVEQRERDALTEMLPAGAQPDRAAVLAWWKHISDPSLWPNERLFFELYAQALQGQSHADGLLDGIVEDWVAPAAEQLIARGVPPARARAHARLGVAVTRGLLLDLLATGDVASVDAAMEEFVDAQLAALSGFA